MPGKLKARTYDLSQTNVAMIGTSLDKATRKAAAETEAAWHGAGTEFGILIWRIEKFNVVAWPEEEYGNFFSGDSYIVLHTYKKKRFSGRKYWRDRMGYSFLDRRSFNPR
jgi:gelsolin